MSNFCKIFSSNFFCVEILPALIADIATTAENDEVSVSKENISDDAPEELSAEISNKDEL